MTPPMCSCGRSPVEPGCDLCGYCRQDYERQEDDREDEEREYPHEDWDIR